MRPADDNAPKDQKERIRPSASTPDLRYKFWHLVLLSANLCIAMLGFYGVWNSLNHNAKSVRNSVQHAMLTHVSNLDRLMVERPHLYGYFYECKPLERGDSLYTEVRAAGMLFLDVLDIVGSQSTVFRENWNEPDAWDRWISDTFEHSPALRQLLSEYSSWYAPRLDSIRRHADASVRTRVVTPPCPPRLPAVSPS
ncbi:MAG TPA: hypothetical protein VFR37_05435 [Longimicrobium sp.]|nr:hypothetical protein [Longimicrobium sp.]